MDLMGEIVIEVYGRHFRYARMTLLKESCNFEELHDELMAKGFWQGTQYDDYLTYFKFLEEV